MDWLDTVINVIWPVASAITPVLLGAGFLWLKSQFPTRADFDALKAKIDLDISSISQKNGEIESARKLDSQRIDRLEQDAEGSPTRIELMKMMGEMSSRLARFEGSAEMLSRQLATQNDYLHTLVEKGLK